MEKPVYEAYSGKPKDARREIVSSSGVLDRKRFLLSASPEWKERIRKLQEIVYELKEEYPEIISLGLFGSLVKGYANKESDIDAYLNIDQIKADERQHQKQFSYRDLVRQKIKEGSGLRDEQVEHIFTVFRDKKVIVREIREGGIFEISGLFLLSIGREINEYRKIVFDELGANGADGEKKWQYIMLDLQYIENTGLHEKIRQKRALLYPKTLAEGRKYFLQESAEGLS